MQTAGNEQDWCSSSDGAGEALELQAEWESRKASHWNSGYRDGLDAGKEQTLQQGFDDGYARGLEAGIGWGGAKGAARTLQLLESAVPGLSAAVLKDTEGAAKQLLNALNQTAMREVCRPLLLQGEQQAAARSGAPSALLEAQAAVLAALPAKGRRPGDLGSADAIAQL